MTPTEQQIYDAYKPLVDFMWKTYRMSLTTEAAQILMDAADKVNENLQEAWRMKCDVEGCNETASSQGMHWRDLGYWCVCPKHSQMGREGKPIPQMKQEAIDREKNRNKDGAL